MFTVLSLGGAARLADSVAQGPGIDGAGVLITIADNQLTVRLTRLWLATQPGRQPAPLLASDFSIAPHSHPC